MKILALSGSLRTASINSAFLRAAAELSPVHIKVSVYTGLGALPLFNPDIEAAPPHPVRDFQAQVSASDAVLIASPEYAHGITGTIKNALDWLVGYEPFAGKRVAVVNTSSRARHADEALREILSTMAARIVDGASITIPLLGTHTNERAMLESPAVKQAIQQIWAALDEK